MAIPPFSNNRLPYCDPPYPVEISKSGQILIKTDEYGIKFEVVGDIHLAATILIEKVVEESKNVISPLTGIRTHYYGVVNFIFTDNKLTGVEASKKAYSNTEAENRPEVLQFVEILSSIIKLKAFW